MLLARQLLRDLTPILRQLEDDIRERADTEPAIDASLRAEHAASRAANRTADAFTAWRDGEVTQAAVAWILNCVFVRFLEDNLLIPDPWIAGPGDRLIASRDRHTAFVRSHPALTDREYLLAAFDSLAAIPATASLFDSRHNPAWRLQPSGDGGRLLLDFFQRRDAAADAPVHDFRDPDLATRFLGDLYQDLSAAAREKYALLQTPEFVERFLLERTLLPAIDQFGLATVRMIDPACGSGHILLGAFETLLDRWQRQDPAANPVALVQRSLAAVHGVDLNPFAVAIARFRLLIAALRTLCVLSPSVLSVASVPSVSPSLSLSSLPDFHLHLTVGDSLLHGPSLRGGHGAVHAQAELGEGSLGHAAAMHTYAAEDAVEISRILNQRYHVVVANPPYITVKDKALNEAYRAMFTACKGKYALVVPFMERCFGLAVAGERPSDLAGHVGVIVANSFMKREFGKPLIEQFLASHDLTHVIDTSGAYIPGHGTPTVILFGGNRPPLADTVRAALGIKGEPGTPDDPAHGLVWTAILTQLELPGSESEFITVEDVPRTRLGKHPWSLQGGGASSVSTQIARAAQTRLGELASQMGIAAVTGADDLYLLPSQETSFRLRVEMTRVMVLGDQIRDWDEESGPSGVWLYDCHLTLRPLCDMPEAARLLWPARALISTRRRFGTPMLERGLTWYEWQELYSDKLRTPLSIAFAFVATHNHFVLDRGGKVFNRSSPVIKLPPDASGEQHLELLGLLNSSTACFWMKQVFHCKGSTVDQHGARQTTVPFEDFWEFDSTKIKQFPIPGHKPLALATDLDRLATELATVRPEAIVRAWQPGQALLSEALAAARSHEAAIRGRMIFLHEELDWFCYSAYGLLGKDEGRGMRDGCLSSPPADPSSFIPHPSPFILCLGQRPFEIALARAMAAGQTTTTWFERHGSTPITDLPADWPADYAALVQHRLDLIASNHAINLLERPEYKRRWSQEPWEKRQQAALELWLQNRIEFHLSGRDLMAEAAGNDSEKDEGRRMKDEAPSSTSSLIPHPSPFAAPALLSAATLAETLRTDPAFLQVAELYRGRQDFDLVRLVSELVQSQGVPFLPRLYLKPSGLRKREAWEETWGLQRREDVIDALTALPEGDPGRLTAAQATERKRQEVGDIPVPPAYVSADFLKSHWWQLRGKLDVPKERYVLFPGCERDADPTPVLCWAGWNHLQRAQAIAAYHEEARNEGWSDDRRFPLLEGLSALVPWLKQWHNAQDPIYGMCLGDYFEEFVMGELRAMGKTAEGTRT